MFLETEAEQLQIAFVENVTACKICAKSDLCFQERPTIYLLTGVRPASWAVWTLRLMWHCNTASFIHLNLVLTAFSPPSFVYFLCSHRIITERVNVCWVIDATVGVQETRKETWTPFGHWGARSSRDEWIFLRLWVKINLFAAIGLRERFCHKIFIQQIIIFSNWKVCQVLRMYSPSSYGAERLFHFGSFWQQRWSSSYNHVLHSAISSQPIYFPQVYVVCKTENGIAETPHEAIFYCKRSPAKEATRRVMWSWWVLNSFLSQTFSMAGTLIQANIFTLYSIRSNATRTNCW